MSLVSRVMMTCLGVGDGGMACKMERVGEAGELLFGARR